MVNLLHTLKCLALSTDFRNFSRISHPTDDLFRVIVDRITRVFNDSSATWAVELDVSA